MNPKNPVFKNEPVDNPNFGSDNLKYVHDNEWYNSANHHYSDKYRYDKKYVTYGVIFALGKTYTKLLLCLQACDYFFHFYFQALLTFSVFLGKIQILVLPLSEIMACKSLQSIWIFFLYMTSNYVYMS